jgi:hypothetical protein
VKCKLKARRITCTTSGKTPRRVSARLSRRGQTLASGRRSGSAIRLVSTRRVARGRYTLTLVIGAGAEATTVRRTVTL